MSLETQLAQEAARPKSTEQRLNDGDLVKIDIDLLDDNPFQPRSSIDAAVLNEFKESIRAKGQLQNILVKPSTDGRFIIVAGHRRTAAFRLLRDAAASPAEKAKFSRIDAKVRLALTDAELSSMAYVENKDREALTLVEEARQLERMIEAGHAATNEELAALTHNDLARVRRLRRLGRAPKWLREAIEKGVMVPTGTGPDGAETKERRTVDLMAAMQIMMLFEHLQKTTPKKAEERSEKFMRRALAGRWNLRRIEAAVKEVIEGRSDAGDDDDSGDAPSDSKPLFSATPKRFTIDLGRLGSASAVQLEALKAAVAELLANQGSKAASGGNHQ